MHTEPGAVRRHRNPVRRGRRLAIAALGLPLAVALATASAGAAIPTPQNAPEQVVGSGAAPSAFSTNVPYLAWRGEQIRAVKCDPALRQADAADVLIEEWSGAAGDRPQIESSTATLFESSTGQSCVRFDAVTLGDGLARIKLVASNSDAEPVMKHQFLMIWMSMGTPAIDEVGANDPTYGPVGSKTEVGDPAGDGQLAAGANNGRVQVKVKGSFPHPLAPSGRFTLPDDWATLAGALESDDQPVNNPMRWDIHDDQGKGAAHVGGWCSGGSLLDDVDNCRLTGGASENGPFSNVYGQGVQAAGPFDPARPATLLSNGVLDADDAPMPAARIDLAIAPNGGGAQEIGGVGALEKANKSEVYSRDGNGTLSQGNLYAPYNQQWIPATASPLPEASGIDGPATGNNFPGFLVNNGRGGLYDNWDIATTLRSAPLVDTQCNRTIRYTDGGSGNQGPRVRGGDDPRVQPYGPQSVVVYTDERGEAQVEYEPYAAGFYYDALPVVRNANRGCDLQDIDVLGRSQISATARYPYQPVSDTAKTSATLEKVVHNQFDKSLSYYPKGAGDSNQNARILVVHANDVDGTPFAGEKVCFYVGDLADGYRGYTGTTGPASAPFYVGGSAATEVGSSICRRLDANGNAAIEVFNSDPELVNVVAEFIDEGLLRSIDLDYRTSGTTGGTTPPAENPGPVMQSAAPRPATGQGTNVPTAEQLRSSGADASVAGTKHAGKAKRLLVARVVRTKSGKRALYVHVRSQSPTARIDVRIGAAKVVRRVITNRLVRVKSVTIKAGAKVKVNLG